MTLDDPGFVFSRAGRTLRPHWPRPIPRIEPGQPHYYRIHGPSVIVEYDNSRNGANHIHTVWHDPGLDFGRDLLKEHLELRH